MRKGYSSSKHCPIITGSNANQIVSIAPQRTDLLHLLVNGSLQRTIINGGLGVYSQVESDNFCVDATVKSKGSGMGVPLPLRGQRLICEV